MKTRLYIAVLMLMLAGCKTYTDCVCPAYYAPVCGENGKTYPNPCRAECDDVSYIDGECPVYGVGVVEYSGDTLCGFYIRILGTSYKPQTLPEEYKVPDLVVGIRYRKMNAWFTCDEPYNNLQEVQLLEIDKWN